MDTGWHINGRGLHTFSGGAGEWRGGCFARLNRGPEFPEMSEEKERELARAYATEVRRLGEYLGRDLGHWLTV